VPVRVPERESSLTSYPIVQGRTSAKNLTGGAEGNLGRDNTRNPFKLRYDGTCIYRSKNEEM